MKASSEESPTLHLLFIAEEVPESSSVAGGLRVSIRRLADELSDRCRVTLLVLHRVLPPMAALQVAECE